MEPKVEWIRACILSFEAEITWAVLFFLNIPEGREVHAHQLCQAYQLLPEVRWRETMRSTCKYNLTSLAVVKLAII